MFDYRRAKKAVLQTQPQPTDMLKKAISPSGNQLMLKGGAAIPSSPSEGTALDDAMRAKYEQQFGLPMGDVRVHHDSHEPAKYNADAFACGSDIFLEAGKENLLPHEITHVAQQKKGLVHPTKWIAGMPLNTSSELERAADMEHISSETSGPAQQGPVIQLHPHVQINHKMQEVNTPGKLLEIFCSGGYDYSHLPEDCLNDAIFKFLRIENYYLTPKHMAQSFEATIAQILKSSKHIGWLTSGDPFVRSNYPKVPEHVDALARHEAKRLAPMPKKRDRGGLITLYHGGPAGLTEILPAQPSFRKPKKADPSRDGFVSVSPFARGATHCSSGQIYRIKLTESQFKAFRFREFAGSGELRTRSALPVHSVVKRKK